MVYIKISEIATNPKQYNTQEVQWENETGLSSPTRTFFWHYIEPYSSDWKDKMVLDIGAGTGWLIKLLRERGAAAIGIEPSEKNINLGKQTNPDIELEFTTLENMAIEQTFDRAVAIMVMTHIKDIEGAFNKISAILNSSGELLIIIPDYDYYKQPRYNYKIQTEELNDREYAALIKRPQGEIADIVRTIEVYKEAGEKTGLKLTEDIPMTPTEDLIKRVPHYKEKKDVVMTHLLRFQKIK